MKTVRLFPTMIMLALSLTSCAGKSVEKIVAINGDLLSQSEITYENACRDVSFLEMDTLIKSNEKFVFYLTSSLCSHCEEFKDKITSYVKDTSTMIYRMDIIASDHESYSPEFIALRDAYKDYFFINDQVATPQIFIVEGQKVADQIPASRYAQKWMFKRAMKDYVRTANIYSFSSMLTYQEFEKTRTDKEYVTFNVDKSSDLYQTYYPSIKTANKEVAIVPIDEGVMIATYHAKDGSTITYSFSYNHAENEAFINQYLK